MNEIAPHYKHLADLKRLVDDLSMQIVIDELEETVAELLEDEKEDLADKLLSRLSLASHKAVTCVGEAEDGYVVDYYLYEENAKVKIDFSKEGEIYADVELAYEDEAGRFDDIIVSFEAQGGCLDDLAKNAQEEYERVCKHEF